MRNENTFPSLLFAGILGEIVVMLLLGVLKLNMG
jgi:hypothetical protein